MRLAVPDRRWVRRLARRTASIGYRSVVVPLLGRDETVYALDLACLLAAERRARIVLVAPLIVEQELPLDAHFHAETARLRARLGEAATLAESYGVGSRRRLVRTRERGLGEALAEIAGEERADLVVLGAPVRSRSGFRRPFPADVKAILRDAPCRVLIVTGPYAARTNLRGCPGAGARPISSSAFSGRTRSSRPPTATSAPRSTTHSASSRSTRSA